MCSSDLMREEAAALREEESLLSRMARTMAAYARGSNEYGLEFMMSFAGIRQSIRDTKADQWEYAATVKDAMDASQAELRKADQSYSDHQRTVANLGQQYDELKSAIDRAMEMPEDIDDQGRAIEHAEIALARAKERQRGLGADATRLDRQEADLAVRDAEEIGRASCRERV